MVADALTDACPGPLVAPSWVAQRLDERALRLVDCRCRFADAEAGVKAYLENHLPGAVRLDLETDLSGPLARHGGRHPLPAPEGFMATLGRLGIDRSTTVIAYDWDGPVAARLWWMLRSIGHERAMVLEGGWSAWVRGGYPTSAHRPSVRPVAYEAPAIWHGIVSRSCVTSRGADAVLIDSRPALLFDGGPNEVDRATGHIPGAVSLPWHDLLSADATWKPPGAIRQQLEALLAAPSVIAYCGSGVTACVNLLAFELVGRTDARLYVGGWSDWASYLLDVDT